MQKWIVNWNLVTLAESFRVESKQKNINGARIETMGCSDLNPNTEENTDIQYTVHDTKIKAIKKKVETLHPFKKLKKNQKMMIFSDTETECI